MNQNTKRLVILNLPYVLLGLYATNLGYAWRLATGADFSEKMPGGWQPGPTFPKR